MSEDKSIFPFYIILLLLCSLLFFLLGHLLDQPFKQPENIIENTTQVNITYKYEVMYKNEFNATLIKINNPCISLRRATGNSMKPFFDNDTTLIIDGCYVLADLKIGDVIVFKDDYADFFINHRIIDIDHIKKWVRTQGDNNEFPDDFHAFDRIYGKTIGFINNYEITNITKA